MQAHLQLGSLVVDVVRKDIKNVHLSVHPPSGRVSIAAPSRMSLETLRVFAISKLDWIRREQRKLQEQEREAPREYLNRESHFLWGKRYLLKVVENDRKQSVEVSHNRIILQVRKGWDEKRKQQMLDAWYRDNLRAAVPAIVAKWEKLMDVKVTLIFVQRMKTKWGSCNHRNGSIRLNTDLAKKPRQCLEYILVHEMTHLLEPTHNTRFVALMDRFLPKWRQHQEVLNRLPVRHERWLY